MSLAAADTSPRPSEDEPRQPREGWQRVAKDVMLWHRPGLSLSVLAASTAVWVVLHPLGLGCTFVTAASWASILALSSLFLWANLAPLFGKDSPDLSGWEISEETALETAATVRGQLESAKQRVFQVVIHREWWVLVQMLATLVALALLGSGLDLLTLLYVGVLASLTLPPLYVKYEDRMKSCATRLRGTLRRWGAAVDEKVVKRVRKKVAAKEKKAE